MTAGCEVSFWVCPGNSGTVGKYAAMELSSSVHPYSMLVVNVIAVWLTRFM